MDKDYINYNESIKEMHTRMDEFNTNLFNRMGENVYESTIESIKNAFQAKDKTALLDELKFFKDVSYMREKVNFGNTKMHFMQPLLYAYMKEIEGISEIPYPPFSMVNTRKINASYMKKNSDNHIAMIVVSDELFTYVQLMCKVIIKIIYIPEQSCFRITDYYELSDSLIGRFSEIIFAAVAPLLNMGNVRQLRYDTSITNASYMLCEICEQFIMAHEYSHFLLDFLCEKEPKLRELREDKPDIVEECFADYMGALLTYEIFRKKDYPGNLTTLGISVAINSLSILDLYYAAWGNYSLSDKYLLFPFRTLILQMIDLDEESQKTINAVNNLFNSFWKKSQKKITELRGLYNQFDTVEDLITSNQYRKIIIPNDQSDNAILSDADLIGLLYSREPLLFEETTNKTIIRNISRFKNGKIEEAYEGFNNLIKTIKLIPEDSGDLQFQKAIAYLYISIIEDIKGETQTAFETIKKVLTTMRVKLSEIGIEYGDEIFHSDNFRFEEGNLLKFQMTRGVIESLLYIYADKNPAKYKELFKVMSDINFLSDEAIENTLSKFDKSGNLRLTMIKLDIEYNNYERAVKNLNYLLHNCGEEALLYHLLSICYLNLNKENEALECIEQALLLSPECDDYIETKINILREMRRYSDALSICNSFIQKRIKPDLLNLRAGIYICMRKYSKALKDLKQSKSFDDNNANTYFIFSKCYFCMGKYDLAMEYIDKAIAIDSDSFYLLNKAKILFSMENYKEACLVFEELLNPIDPDVELLSYIVRCLFHLENADIAKRLLVICISREPNNPKTLLAQSELHIYNEEYLKAIELLGTIITSDEQIADAYKLRALAYKKISNNKREMQDLTQIKKLQSDIDLEI